MADISARVLRLLSLLQGGHSFSGDELARRLQTSPRTLRRDVERLKNLGYPVTSVRGPSGYYRMRAGSAMPPLMLDDDEAVAIALGLRLAAGSGTVIGITPVMDRARDKVIRMLPQRLRLRMHQFSTAVDATMPGRPQLTTQTLRLLSEAIMDHRLLSFDYTDRSGETSSRTVEPYRQVLMAGRWYLLGWNIERRSWRTFRIDRIQEPVVGPAHFTPRPFPDDTASYIENQLGIGQARRRAVIELHTSVTRAASLLTDPTDLLEPRDSDNCVLTTYVDSFEWLALRLGVLGVDFTIVEPREFADYTNRLAARLAAATRTGPQ